MLRRLLIKLLAVETALVGWLGYWLFLVYANNPAISQGLASQLGRFPQLSFTTVDISVLVIVSGLSIFLAFKFHRGLRPGIRLERALQMLESLMKRNLLLEAQVGELKLEKAHVAPPTLSPPSAEARPGSWERAFRTPIEAGAQLPTPNAKPSGFSPGETGVDREFGLPHLPSARFETKPVEHLNLPVQPPKPAPVIEERHMDKPVIAPEKPREKPPTVVTGSDPSTWEDSPGHSRETTGVAIPLPPPHRPTVVVPYSGAKQPYIPVPVPKTAPPGITVGSGAPPRNPQLKPTVRPMGVLRPIPKNVPASPGKPLQPIDMKLDNPPPPVVSTSPRPTTELSPASEPAPKPPAREGSHPGPKSPSKPLKKFSYEED